MNLLAIDTSTEACSVALAKQDQLFSRYELKPREHTRLILPMVDDLLNQSKLTLKDLSALVISIGPGSFAGLRIGAGVVQGLAFANNLPVIMISSLQLLAQTAFRELNTKRIAVLQNAHMQEVYFGLYSADEKGVMRAEKDDQILKPEALPVIKDEYAVIGSAWPVYEEVLKAKFPNRLDVNTQVYPHAEDLIILAKSGALKNNPVTASEVLPVYLRTADAWKKS